MRKRRRLADKMTIMVCAVLIAVSAFFYAPMEVSALSYGEYLHVGSAGYDLSYTAGTLKFITESNYDWEYYNNITNGTSTQIQSQYVYRDSTNSINITGLTSSRNIPFNTINGSAISLSTQRFLLDAIFYITPHIFLGNTSLLDAYDCVFNLTQAYIIAYGQKYACSVTESNGQYIVRFTGALDSNLPVAMVNNTAIGLELIGEFAGFVVSDSSKHNWVNSTVEISYDIQASIGEDAFRIREIVGDPVTNSDIENQTSDITNGFDSSQGDSVNSDLSAGLNEFQTAEDSLFATASSGLDDFTFFNFASIPAMVTGMSFVSSIMTSWFNQAGGASGVGIVLSILFSIMLVAMVLGLYRWYQSKGGKD